MSEKARQHRELPERPMADMLHSSANRLWAHMPGHGGRPVVPLGDLYSLDTTETTVTDDLYAPGSGILKAQEAYARAAHAARTLFLHNGSTQGIHIMLEMGCRDGDTVILPRNAHLSATQACVLGGLRIVWVPVYVQGSETFVMPEDVLQAMRAHPEARKVLLTRPDYFGGCMAEDAVRTIAQEAHAMGMQLVVDEAHGAHFPFGGPIASCSELGADAWVQSVHKERRF